MLNDRLAKLLTRPQARTPSAVTIFWFVLSLAYAFYCSYLWTWRAFKNQYVIQSDARQVVTWMLRFTDPDLFKNDLIANYYLSANTDGFTLLYRAMAELGVDPITLSKILPMIIGLAATVYCFALFINILPVPAGAFISCLLLNQHLWTDDAVPSATPRAFLYPLFLAFLFYLVRRRFVGTLVTIALEGLFYPPIMFISAGVLVLSLIGWSDGRFRFSKERRDYLLCAAAIAVAVIIMSIYTSRSSEFGPRITRREALSLPASFAGKRLDFLHNPAFTYWITDSQSGLYSHSVFPPFGLFAGLGLPALLLLRRRFALASRVTAGIKLLPRTLASAIFMFFAAHLLLFKLYLPSRYTAHTFPIVLSLAAGVAFTLIMDGVLGQADLSQKPDVKTREMFALVTIVLIAGLLFLYPSFLRRFPKRSLAIGMQPDLYRFLSEQPKDSLIATLSLEANNLPSFARRSVLAAPHFSNPYQAKYYLEVNQRYADLIEATYTPDREQLRNFINRYGVDLILLERATFTREYVTNHPVVKRFKPQADEITDHFDAGITPALSDLMKDCTVFESKEFTLARADCICGKSQK
jgi:hypothetical protein